jgi:hypothetical protein
MNFSDKSLGMKKNPTGSNPLVNNDMSISSGNSGWKTTLGYNNLVPNEFELAM